MTARLSVLGFGVRMCIGSRLAQVETRAIVAEIIRRFHVTVEDPTQEIRVGNRFMTEPSPYPNFVFDAKDKQHG